MVEHKVISFEVQKSITGTIIINEKIEKEARKTTANIVCAAYPYPCSNNLTRKIYV